MGQSCDYQELARGQASWEEQTGNRQAAEFAGCGASGVCFLIATLPLDLRRDDFLVVKV